MSTLLKDALRMMAFSARVTPYWKHQLSVMEIAIVGEQQYLQYSMSSYFLLLKLKDIGTLSYAGFWIQVLYA